MDSSCNSSSVDQIVRTHFREYKTSGKNYLVQCCYCGSSEKHPLSMVIDQITGVYICNRANSCGARGNLYNLKLKFGIIKPKALSFKVKTFTPIKKELPKPQERKISFFEKRKILPETLKFFGVYLSEYGKQPSICFLYYYQNKLANIKYRLPDKKFAQEKGNYSTLWNIDNVLNLREIIITEGEMDCMALWQVGLKNVTSVPSGVKNLNWIDNCWDLLQTFKTIYIAMDTDQAGSDALEEISSRLGKYRCKRLVFGDFKDANDALIGGFTDWNKSFDTASDIVPATLTQPQDHYHAIIAELNNPDYLNGSPSVFNSLYRKGFKGFRLKEVTLWTGFTGEGKTTLVFYEILHQFTHGNKACIASLECSPSRWLKVMIQQVLGKSNLDAGSVESAIGWLQEHMTIVNYVGKISVNELMECFEYSAKRFGCKHFVIDNLMKIDLNLDHGYKGHKDFINQLSKFANEFDVHVHLIAHQKKPDDKIKTPRPKQYNILGSSELANGTDNLISIYRLSEEEKEKNSGFSAYLNVLKQREYSERPGIPLYFFAESRRFSDDKESFPVNFINEINKEVPF